MSDALVATKLLPPLLRHDRVPRPRLAGPLARASDAALTVVSAPAGFGKTSLVATWVADSGHASAWVSLDERDRQPAAFWSYVLSALERAVAGSAAAALTLWQSGRAPVERVLGGVVNELSVHDGDVVLVLDDYHLADGPDVAAGMSFLVDHLPPQLHLVISTRADPGLPLPRLRARGELVEIRAAELRFDLDEVAAYFNDLNGLGLPDEAVVALEARTEGWVAALQLAALSLRDRTDASAFVAEFTGDDRYVVDYLVEEVLDRQPEPVRRFLLDTSILRRLTAPLCDAVQDGTDRQPVETNGTKRAGGSRAMLDLLDRRNLFLIPLDDNRRWYRYHHLFADVLHAHLTLERPEEIAELHRRASRWYADNGDVEEAVRHALSAGDTDTAADLVEHALPELRRQRREQLLRRWADEIPGQALRNRPVLAIGLVGGLMASNDFDDVERRLEQVEDMLAGPPSELVTADPAALARVPAETEMYRAALSLVRGDPVATIARAERAAAAAPEGDDLTRASTAALRGLASWASGDIVAAHTAYLGATAALTREGYIADALGSTLAIADMELALGRLHDADRTLQDGLKLADRHRPDGGSPMRGTSDMLVAQARAAWHRDDLAAAADLLRRADDLGESAGLPQNPYRWRVAMARLRAAQRDWATALELLDEAERVYVGDFSPPVHPIHASRARVLIARGDLTGALEWARRYNVHDDDDLTYLREYEHVTLARLMLAQHRVTDSPVELQNATALLDRLLAAAEAGNRAGTVIEVEVLRAAAHHTAGDNQAGRRALEHAVDLAEPQGWTRFLIDAAPALADLVSGLAAQRPGSEYLHALLTSSRETPSPSNTAAPPAPEPAPTPQPLLDPLSDRELDVLRLLGSDLDGPAIAREMIVSLNTVRTHTKRIYTKLGVNNRRAAVSRAHQLGLLARTRRR
ncbi:helix-turn-helix transcriptional regulator [Nocardioides mesophilus]|uniref:Helix-turn-helix transcriptional regulator n=1 Tax=Nocardioides mesophilus TaxID=433659 RepID=A0A7G9RAL6_9ACTN|nr:helix-turn-helix transcriptional regulator [Nocardioides mesophilus]